MSLKFRRGAVGIIATICFSLGNQPVAFGEVIYEYAGGLNQLCTSQDVAAKAVCEGFIGGVLDVVANNSIYGFTACIPPMTPMSKAADVTKNWLTVHPESSTRPASSAIAQALAEAFPCK